MATSPHNRGPSHSILGLMDSQAGRRDIVCFTPPGYLADRLGTRSDVTVELLSANDRPGTAWVDAWRIGRGLRRLRRRPGGRPPEAVLVANSVGAALRCIPVTRRTSTPLLLVLRSEHMPLRDVLKCWALVLLVDDLRFFAVSPYVQGLAYGARATGSLAVRVLPNLVDASAFADDRTVGRPDRPLRLAYVGSCSRRKGLDVLAEVLSDRLDEGVEVTLVGVSQDWIDADPSSTATELRRLQAVMSIQALGRVSSATEALAHADVAFLPAPIESFGRAVLEAMAAGCAVVCSDNPGHMSVADGDTAFLFEAGNVRSARDALDRALADREELARVARRGRRRAMRFSVDAYAMPIARILDEPVPDAAVRLRWLSGNRQPDASQRERLLAWRSGPLRRGSRWRSPGKPTAPR
ncbi:MAG TPA: glycosyltransferase family 4 protein [Iamia sp.]|nr:glycosyltransferase family 4 protein [Iamia sp.]